MNQQEIINLHGYLTHQSMRRTPQQLLEALQATYQEFVEVLLTMSDGSFSHPTQEGEWSAAQVLEHVQAVVAVYQQAICTAIHGEQPGPIRGEIAPPLRGATREMLLSALETSYQQLRACVLQADPVAQLDITWEHFELGPMHWRQWLLFIRVHLADHVRQVQQILAKMGPTAKRS